MYSLKQINEAIRSDPAAFARECDRLFAKKVENAARKIADHREESRALRLREDHHGPENRGKAAGDGHRHPYSLHGRLLQDL